MCQFYQRASMILWERAIEEGLHLAPGFGGFFQTLLLRLFYNLISLLVMP